MTSIGLQKNPKKPQNYKYDKLKAFIIIYKIKNCYIIYSQQKKFQKCLQNAYKLLT